ncbi:MAG TPA: GNAT family N-acetyltransferase [Phycisphaerales bacterium]|nr:GNAT family N-acetyltransferase [Phycisphaerales bacterium]
MSLSPLIRPVTDADFPAVAALTNHFILSTPIHFSTEPVTPDELRASWHKTRDVYPYLVAEVNGRFAGYCKAGVWRERAAYNWTPECGIYVDPSIHRRGVGRALYERLFDIMRAQGFHSIIGGVTLPNEPSVALHESVGFTKVGHVAHAGWKFNRWWDVGFWQKMLQPEGHAAKPLAPPR